MLHYIHQGTVCNRKSGHCVGQGYAQQERGPGYTLRPALHWVLCSAQYSDTVFVIPVLDKSVRKLVINLQHFFLSC